LLEEQINIIFGELSEFDDFEYYMKCVAKMRMKIQKEIVSDKQYRKRPIVFQLGMGEDKEKHDVTSTNIRFDEKL